MSATLPEILDELIAVAREAGYAAARLSESEIAHANRPKGTDRRRSYNALTMARNTAKVAESLLTRRRAAVLAMLPEDHTDHAGSCGTVDCRDAVRASERTSIDIRDGKRKRGVHRENCSHCAGASSEPTLFLEVGMAEQRVELKKIGCEKCLICKGLDPGECAEYHWRLVTFAVVSRLHALGHIDTHVAWDAVYNSHSEVGRIALRKIAALLAGGAA